MLYAPGDVCLVALHMLIASDHDHPFLEEELLTVDEMYEFTALWTGWNKAQHFRMRVF